MSRPQPKIVASYHRGPREIEICAADAVYAVFRCGEPIKIRTRQQDFVDGYKYSKTMFPEPGHAIRLAQQLNRQFNTEDYTVVILSEGREVQVGK